MDKRSNERQSQKNAEKRNNANERVEFANEIDMNLDRNNNKNETNKRSELKNNNNNNR